MLDNQAIYEICEKRLGICNPNFADTNTVIADHLSLTFASMRFGGSTNRNLNELITDLVPYPRLHFVAPSKAPYTATNNQKDNPSVNEIVESVFNC